MILTSRADYSLAGGAAAASRQAGAGKRAEEPVDRLRLALSVVQVLLGEPGTLPVQTDSAVDAGVGAVPVVAHRGSEPWPAAADCWNSDCFVRVGSHCSCHTAGPFLTHVR